MNAAYHLCLTSLAAFTLLPPGCGEEPPGDVPELTAKHTAKQGEPATAPAPHPIFEHWEAVLTEQSEPERLFGHSVREGEALSEEEQSELEETRGHIATALEAAKALFNARLAVIRHALNIPGSVYLPEVCSELDAFPTNENWTEEGAAVFSTCRAWVAEGFRRDLEALSFCESWLDAGCVEPGLRPGRQELLFRPTFESLAFSTVDGCTGQICSSYSELNEFWHERQNRFMEAFITRYNNDDSALSGSGRQDPFTGIGWLEKEKGKMPPDIAQYRTTMQDFLRREQQAWVQYKQAMEDLVCPCSGYRGSGMGIFISNYESFLLDSRERFLCLLLVGTQGLGKLNKLEPERAAELRELHSQHRFGEIFTGGASLFRHPQLEGNPWCIRFEAQGAGFIPVADGSALRRYAKEYPDGGELEVRGYQSIEVSGKPYVAVEKKDESGKQKGCPRGGLAPRQVFILQQYVAEADE